MKNSNDTIGILILRCVINVACRINPARRYMCISSNTTMC